jgi:hypothetical protein
MPYKPLMEAAHYSPLNQWSGRPPSGRSSHVRSTLGPSKVFKRSDGGGSLQLAQPGGVGACRGNKDAPLVHFENLAIRLYNPCARP